MIRRSAIAGMLASALMVGGCLLSATFVVQVLFRDSDMGDHTVRYHKLVDITTEPDWQDNKDKIHTIELVGFQLWITNNIQGNSFNLYVDDGDDPEQMTRADVDANTTKIINALALPAGEQRYVRYSESLRLLQNEDILKALVKEGKFHFYATSKNPNIDFTLDSVRVIVTLSAGN
ncbi:MAG: hypothetical protein AB1644_04540 [Candidatus Zixiibacteriota bacterium]